jgi:hypothetical protein
MESDRGRGAKHHVDLRVMLVVIFLLILKVVQHRRGKVNVPGLNVGAVRDQPAALDENLERLLVESLGESVVARSQSIWDHLLERGSESSMHSCGSSPTQRSAEVLELVVRPVRRDDRRSHTDRGEF